MNRYFIIILCTLIYLFFLVKYIKVFYEALCNKSSINFSYGTTINIKYKKYIIFYTLLSIFIILILIYSLFISNFLLNSLFSALFILNISTVRRKFIN